MSENNTATDKTITSQSTKTNILFVSQYCKHCNVLMNELKNHQSIIQSFDIVIVENVKIPEYIDRVPTLILNNNKLLTDDDLFSYIENLFNTGNKNKDIEPFMVKEMGSSMSDNYSYLTDNMLNHNFEFINKPHTINTPKDDDGKIKINFDQYLASRDHELKSLVSA